MTEIEKALGTEAAEEMKKVWREVCEGPGASVLSQEIQKEVQAWVRDMFNSPHDQMLAYCGYHMASLEMALKAIQLLTSEDLQVQRAVVVAVDAMANAFILATGSLLFEERQPGIRPEEEVAGDDVLM